jgi:hypothetical protein
MSNAEAAVAAAGGSIHDFRKATRKMRWWYESLADFMIANPGATQNEIAAHFQRNPATISTIINTDAFKAYFRQRRTIYAERLDTQVRDKLFAVTNKSLDHILEVLDKKRDTIPLEMLQRTAESSLKSLGYGATPPAGTTVNVNAAPQTVQVAVSLDDLQLAREALRRNQHAVVIDQGTPPLGRGADQSGIEGRGSGGPDQLASEQAALGGGADQAPPSVTTLKDLA